jgi:hypothetical protein
MNNNIVIDTRCHKRAYKDKAEVRAARKELVKSNKRLELHYYICETCSKFHLTKKSPKFFKHRQKYNSDIRYRNKYNEQKFIERETQKWEEHFQKLTK